MTVKWGVFCTKVCSRTSREIGWFSSDSKHMFVFGSTPKAFQGWRYAARYAEWATEHGYPSEEREIP